jgi:hypothetical protein
MRLTTAAVALSFLSAFPSVAGAGEVPTIVLFDREWTLARTERVDRMPDDLVAEEVPALPPAPAGSEYVLLRFERPLQGEDLGRDGREQPELVGPDGTVRHPTSTGYFCRHAKNGCWAQVAFLVPRNGEGHVFSVAGTAFDVPALDMTAVP